jgi:hypothetical protein
MPFPLAIGLIVLMCLLVPTLLVVLLHGITRLIVMAVRMNPRLVRGAERRLRQSKSRVEELIQTYQRMGREDRVARLEWHLRRHKALLATLEKRRKDAIDDL